MNTKKKLPNKIVLTITKNDCVGTVFTDCGNCAVAKSFKRRFGEMVVSEGVNGFSVYPTFLSERRYYHRMFTDEDMNQILETGKSKRLTLTL